MKVKRTQKPNNSPKQEEYSRCSNCGRRTPIKFLLIEGKWRICLACKAKEDDLAYNEWHAANNNEPPKYPPVYRKGGSVRTRK